MVNLQSGLQPEMEASMMALSEILQDKLKNHHRNLGTLGCKEALSERKRLCTELGLLRTEDQDMIKSLAEPLPLAHAHHTVEDEELLNCAPKTPSYVPRDEMDRVWPQSPGTITVAPQLDDCAISEELLRSCSTKRRADRPRSQDQAKRARKTTLFKYFSASQK